MKPTVALCYGTRPQVIKASALRRALAETLSVFAIDTGQHYDYELNQLLYRQLEVERPDRLLEVGSASHAVQTGAMLARAEQALQELAPDAVVVIGDTNSTLAGALAAAKLRIPVVHVEAGLRAADTLLAEEINRRAVDSVAQLLLTPCARATARLEQERAGSEVTIIETGDVMYDVLTSQGDTLPPVSEIVPADTADSFIFATLHRAELTGDSAALAGALTALDDMPVPVILPLHPRTAKAIERAFPGRTWEGSLKTCGAVGYRESLSLSRNAELVVTDSGGVQREAYWFGTPCVTLRRETEWIETVDVGANVVLDPSRAGSGLPQLAENRVEWRERGWDRTCYGDGRAAGRIAEAVTRWLTR